MTDNSCQIKEWLCSMCLVTHFPPFQPNPCALSMIFLDISVLFVTNESKEAST